MFVAMPLEARHGLRIGGLQPFTTLDFPGRLAAVVFLQGCPLRCVYCHNRDLIPTRGAANLTWDDVEAFLDARAGLLDAVVFSGGEPLVQAGLSSAMEWVRSRGFAVGLHTSGIAPERLAALEELVDWVGLDLKAPIDGYAEITGVPGSGLRACESFDILVDREIAHEVRVTVWPDRIGCSQIEAVADLVASRKSANFVLQEARHPQTGTAMGGAVFENAGLLAALAYRFPGFQLRRATG